MERRIRTDAMLYISVLYPSDQEPLEDQVWVFCSFEGRSKNVMRKSSGLSKSLLLRRFLYSLRNLGGSGHHCQCASQLPSGF